MTGTARFVLAWLVVVSHLVGNDGVAHFGFYAVRAFFALSGFVMTAALNETYHFDWRRFFANRLLRVLPLYYATCALTWFALEHAPDLAGLFSDRWLPAHDPLSIAGNLLVLPLASAQPNFRFFAPGWSIAVELIMYGLMAAVFARSERLAVLALAIGVVYHVCALALGTPFSARYFNVPSALLSFPLGASIYFWKRRGALARARRALPATSLLWAANLLIGSGLAMSDRLGAGYYINIALCGAVVAGLTDLKCVGVRAGIDRLLGQLSYPIFLVHWIAAFGVFVAVPQIGLRGWGLMLATVPVALSIAAVFAILHARLVVPVRTSMRHAAMARGAARSRFATGIFGRRGDCRLIGAAGLQEAAQTETLTGFQVGTSVSPACPVASRRA